MIKYFSFLFLFAFATNAQNKKQKPNANAEVKADTSISASDTLDVKGEELKAAHQFGAYTRKPYKPLNRMKLCLNIPSGNYNYNFCINDSICKNPEYATILFQKSYGDTNYVLVLVDAFTKADDKPNCDAGHETKLFFINWDLSKNKATYKQKTVASCIKSITYMSNDPIKNWDKTSILKVNYHKGGTAFVELKFDPENYMLGLQSNSE